jgi:O-antigen ligase
LIIVKSTSKLVFTAVLLGTFVVAIIAMLPGDVFSSDLTRLLLVCGSVLVTLFITYQRTTRGQADRISFRLGMVLWWFLLCSEALFPRSNNGLDNAAAGNFSLTAYSEAIFWTFLAICLLMVLGKDWRQMTNAFRGRTVLMSLLVGLCGLSVLWAPEKGFSLAWVFKLLLGVAVVGYWFARLRSLRDVRSLMIVTFWAFTFMTVVPVIEGTLNPASAFSGTSMGREAVVEEGRFHATAHPLTIGGRAGIMALLALLFYSLERKRMMIAVALGCAALIGLAGAKTAFLAAAISVGLFFALRKRVLIGLAFVGAIGVLGVLIVSMTAVGGYVRDYLQKDELMTISGRTDLWSAAWPEITSHLALGHGYVSSKFISMDVGIPWYAGHMHNAILETLYNNGLPGLAILLAINWFIATDLISLYRHAVRREIRMVATALLALYAFIFLNGLTESYFGGQASAFYLLFLGLFSVSEWLRAYRAELVTSAVEAPIRSTQAVISPAYR